MLQQQVPQRKGGVRHRSVGPGAVLDTSGVCAHQATSTAVTYRSLRCPPGHTGPRPRVVPSRSTVRDKDKFRAHKAGGACWPWPPEFVQLDEDYYWWDRKSCKQPGCVHPHVQALLSERGTCRYGGPEEALVGSGGAREEHSHGSRQPHASSIPAV